MSVATFRKCSCIGYIVVQIALKHVSQIWYNTIFSQKYHFTPLYEQKCLNSAYTSRNNGHREFLLCRTFILQILSQPRARDKKCTGPYMYHIRLIRRRFHMSKKQFIVKHFSVFVRLSKKRQCICTDHQTNSGQYSYSGISIFLNFPRSIHAAFSVPSFR